MNNTKIVKSHNGWEAQTDIDMKDDRILRLRTSKAPYGGGLRSHVQTYKKDGNGFISFVLFQDFGKTIKTSTDRCTENNVTAQHAGVMTGIDAIVEQADAFYAQKCGVSA